MFKNRYRKKILKMDNFNDFITLFSQIGEDFWCNIITHEEYYYWVGYLYGYATEKEII